MCGQIDLMHLKHYGMKGSPWRAAVLVHFGIKKKKQYCTRPGLFLVADLIVANFIVAVLRLLMKQRFTAVSRFRRRPLSSLNIRHSSVCLCFSSSCMIFHQFGCYFCIALDNVSAVDTVDLSRLRLVQIWLSVRWRFGRAATSCISRWETPNELHSSRPA